MDEVRYRLINAFNSFPLDKHEVDYEIYSGAYSSPIEVTISHRGNKKFVFIHRGDFDCQNPSEEYSIKVIKDCLEDMIFERLFLTN